MRKRFSLYDKTVKIPRYGCEQYHENNIDCCFLESQLTTDDKHGGEREAWSCK